MGKLTLSSVLNPTAALGSVAAIPDYFSAKEDRKVAENQFNQNQQNFVQQHEWDLQDREFAANLSREFGKNSSGWQLKDVVSSAKEMGINPLAAIGSATGSSPTAHVSGGGSVPGQTVSGSRRGDLFRLVSDVAQTLLGVESSRLSNKLDEERIKTEMMRQQAIASDIARSSKTGGTEITIPAFGDVTTGPHTQQQVIEDEYGGIVGEGYGIWRFLNDIGHAIGTNVPLAPKPGPSNPKRPSSGRPRHRIYKK